MSRQIIKLIRSGNRVMVDTTQKALIELLASKLTFTSKTMVYGWGAGQAGGNNIQLQDHACYIIDHRGRLATSFGFYSRIIQVLGTVGCDVEIETVTPHPDPSVFSPVWDRLTDDPRLELRYGQDKFLAVLMSLLAHQLPGRFDCPPGYGKTRLLAFAGLLLPRAKIHIATDRIPILCNRILPELQGMLPSVGVVGGGKNITNKRIMLYSFDSLHKSTFDADILFVDECLPAGTLIDGVPIENIKVGNVVRSVSADYKLELRPVVRLFKRYPAALSRLWFVDGTSLVATPNHPVYCIRRGFVRLADIDSGDKLLRYESRTIGVDRVAVLEPTNDGTFGGVCPDGYVYNLEVDINHNYFANNILVHNCHESAADVVASKLAHYDRSVNIGLSATCDMRLDGKDMRVEAMFGPVVYKMDYAEACQHGLVVPIEVVWSDVIIDIDPCAGIFNKVQCKRVGIWRNSHRNQIIANDAGQYDDDTQCLISVETIEHALALKKLLPDYTLAYSAAGLAESDLRWFKNQGLWPENHLTMTQARLCSLQRDFERGVLRKAIATTVWNVGVDFKKLQVLLRADAGASPTMDTQIPGRTSRVGEKLFGRVHDYKDQFNKSFKRRAKERHGNYVGHGWNQINWDRDALPPPPRTRRLV